MQPCTVCGGVTTDAAGYCMRCGTHRGPAGQPPAGPVPGGRPVGGPPGTGHPVGGPPDAPSDRARSFLVPLITLSVTLAVLVVAIVVVLVVRGRADRPAGVADPGRSPAGSAGSPAGSTGAPAADVDPCVVGTWQVTSHRESLSMGAPMGVVPMTGGQGAVYRFGGDGTGGADYGTATVFEGRAEGRTLKVEVSGTVTYRFTARDGTLAMRDTRSAAVLRLYLDGAPYGSPTPFNVGADPSNYTCSGASMTQGTTAYTTTFTKVG
jgi:hypothetical protein